MYYLMKKMRRKKIVQKSSVELRGFGLAEEKKLRSEKSIIEIDVSLSEDCQASEMVSSKTCKICGKISDLREMGDNITVLYRT